MMYHLRSREKYLYHFYVREYLKNITYLTAREDYLSFSRVKSCTKHVQPNVLGEIENRGSFGYTRE